MKKVILLVLIVSGLFAEHHHKHHQPYYPPHHKPDYQYYNSGFNSWGYFVLGAVVANSFNRPQEVHYVEKVVEPPKRTTHKVYYYDRFGNLIEVREEIVEIK